MLYVTDTQGQNTSITNFINCVELQNGTDNLLMNGRPYAPSNTKAKEHPYFQTDEWKPGKVYINGNTYPVDQLKYNLSSFQLVLRHQRPNGTTQKVILSDLLIDSFYIEIDLFVNRILVLPEKENGGYLEKVFVDKLPFYRLQKKVFNSTYSKDTPYGKFTNQKPVFYLLKDGKQYKIIKKKEFLACFPEHKVPIKKYLKTHSINWKKITKTQLYQLLKFCNDQI